MILSYYCIPLCYLQLLSSCTLPGYQHVLPLSCCPTRVWFYYSCSLLLALINRECHYDMILMCHLWFMDLWTPIQHEHHLVRLRHLSPGLCPDQWTFSSFYVLLRLAVSVAFPIPFPCQAVKHLYYISVCFSLLLISCISGIEDVTKYIS